MDGIVVDHNLDNWTVMGSRQVIILKVEVIKVLNEDCSLEEVFKVIWRNVVNRLSTMPMTEGTSSLDNGWMSVACTEEV